MKILKSTLLITAGTLLALTILIELNVISYNNEQNISCQYNTSWSSQSVETDASSLLKKGSTLNNDCKAAKKFDDIPVRVTYGSLNYGDPVNCRTIIIPLNDIAIDMIWSPVINSADFSLAQPIEYNCKVLNEAEQKVLLIDGDGMIGLTGTLELSGIYSNNEARNYVAKYVMKIVYKAVKDQLKSKQK